MWYTKNITLVSLMLALVGLSGCFERQEQQKKGLVVVNVLDKELYDDCHIKESINIPFEMIEEQACAIDKDAQVVVYCSNYRCTTSEYAAKKFCQLGFRNVCVYMGGTAEWFQEKLPIAGPHRLAYLKKQCPAVAAENNGNIPTITTHELAKKMGIKL